MIASGGPRALLERLSRHRIVRRRLPAAFGGRRLYVSPDAALGLWRPGLGHFDPQLLRLAGELVGPGDRVWDVGANIGLFAFAAAHRAGREGHVLAIEADDWLTGLLRRSAAGGGAAARAAAPVEVLTAAVADGVGLARFAIAERGRAGSHLASAGGSTQTGGARERRPVVTVSLDWLLERQPPPDVLKIDVEGAEAAVLRGAGRLLAESRPKILCEVTDDNRGEVGELLGSRGYRLFDASLPAAERRQLAQPVWNTLALPESKS